MLPGYCIFIFRQTVELKTKIYPLTLNNKAWKGTLYAKSIMVVPLVINKTDGKIGATCIRMIVDETKRQIKKEKAKMTRIESKILLPETTTEGDEIQYDEYDYEDDEAGTSVQP